MRKKTLLLMLAIALLLTSGVFGQSNPKAGYLEYAGENQSRNIPAGVVMDPASHLTYIIDTGYNMRTGGAEVDDPANSGFPNIALRGLGRAWEEDVYGEDGEAGPDGERDLANAVDPDDEGNLYRLNQNFITITNTHPTHAVTVHFRYFNDNCEDILDFLVVLTCNDTLIFDPWNFDIPGTGENTKFRIWPDPDLQSILQPMTAQDWGSGRFLVTASAVGTSIDADDDAEILFPKEFNGDDHCNIKSGTSSSDLDGTLDEILDGNVTSVANKGIEAGISQWNLHVFNSSQVVHNYLIGTQVTAVPGSLLTISGIRSASWSVPAWGRPAVDRSNDQPVYNDPSALTGYPDGDGPAAVTGKIVSGGEWVYQSNRSTRTILNELSLRNDVHGGDVQQQIGSVSTGGFSSYGALMTNSLFGDGSLESADRLVQHFMSVADDYDGSSNTGWNVSLQDRAANIVPAASTYIMQLYDNDEDLFYLEEETPLNISPPVVVTPVKLKLICFCLRTFLTDEVLPQTNVDDVSISDMARIFSTEILTGTGKDPEYDGFLDGGSDESDLSKGTIRWVRDNTFTLNLAEIPGTATNTRASLVGSTVANSPAHGPGTSTFDQNAPFLVDIDDTVSGFLDYGPSFLVQALQVTTVLSGEYGYAIANWEFSSASDCEVSNVGDPEHNYKQDPPLTCGPVSVNP